MIAHAWQILVVALAGCAFVESFRQGIVYRLFVDFIGGF